MRVNKRKDIFAVFVKQDDGTYLLINGNPNDEENPGITAILDGDCALPEGVTLVIPEDSHLLLQSVSRQGDEYSTTEILGATEATWYAGNKATAPKLTIPEGSALIVGEGASLEFHPLSGRTIFRTSR